MNYALILAGGIGSRFWPLSSEIQPKQFLSISSGKPMIGETINRVSRLIKKERIYIAANKLHAGKIKTCLKEFRIPRNNILFEPRTKNNLAPIALMASRIYASDNKAVIVVLPCDHIIKQKNRFLASLKKAIAIAEDGYIVSLGVPPRRPEIGYGYIKIRPQATSHRSQVYKVDKFIEKPPLSMAKRFIKDKRYYWNSGIFIFRADVILDEVRRFNPGLMKTITKIKNTQDLLRLWPQLPSVSIDYAVMEKTKKMALLPYEYGWLDLGSWQALEEILKKDKHRNIFKGNCIDVGSRNILAWSEVGVLATLGLKDMIIVNTKNALLVCSKEKAQEVKKIARLLKDKNCKK